MRICLLTNQDLDGVDEGMAEGDWPCDPRPLLPHDDWTLKVFYDREGSIEKVEELIAEGYDLFFNLLDGPADGEDAGVEVVKILEKHGVPFTGASSRFFEPTRPQMKAACRKLGIKTPKGVTVRKEEDVEKVLQKLRFPMFVKHYNSYASVDLSRHSKVATPEGLRRQITKILSRHKAALVEEFIEGTECTVLVAENPKNPQKPIVYTPVQFRFPEGSTFKHEDLKWVDYEGLSAIPVEDEELNARLKDEAARFFLELEGTSYGRSDVRVSEDGTTYTLEMNSNCGLFYPPADYSSADFCLSLDPAGHEGFVEQLVIAAFARAGKRLPNGWRAATEKRQKERLAKAEAKKVKPSKRKVS
ncbi:MAG: D-alanine--D-alanine ligase [Planctomycetota bacterium]